MSTKGGSWGAIIAVIGILFCLTPGLHAQGVRYDNIVLGPRGGPVASANIAVCAAGASTSSAPCSPLATIYSDEALTQPLANPMRADSLGNYGFWAAPGHYIVQIYRTGLTTRTMNVFLPCDPSNCSMSNATFSSITAGTLNLTGALTVNGRSVATEPVAADAVMYVSPNGNDSSDGLSWGSAKQTLYAAVSALQATLQGGTLYVAAGTACGGPVSGQGLWLIGAGDSAYSSPPSGWIKVSHPMKIVGVGVNGTTTQNAPATSVAVSCGTSGSGNTPLWISGVSWASELEFDHLNFMTSTASNALKLGISTSGSRTASGDSDIIFNGDSFGVANTGSVGPTIDIGTNVFWIRFNNTGINANAGATALSDAHQGVVVNPAGAAGSSSGLIWFNHTEINGGGIRFYGSGVNGGSLYVHDLTTENQNDGSPAVEISGGIGTGDYRIDEVTVADATVSPTYAVKVDSSLTNKISTASVVVSNVQGKGQNVSGPMTILSQYPNNYVNAVTEPSAEGQVGFFNGHVYGQVDAARRTFAPVASRWQNRAAQIPSNWTVTSDGAVSRNNNATGPDGSDLAMDISQTGGTYTPSVLFGSYSTTFAVGDYIIGGGWFRSVNGGFSAPGFPFALSLSSPCAFQAIYDGQYFGNTLKGDGQWTWAAAALKVTTGGSCAETLGGNYDASHEMGFFAPIMLHIPAGQISDNEAADIAQNLASYPNGLTPPVESTLRDHPFAFGGSGDNHFATLDHTALTANRTYSFPDTNGAVCLATTCGGQVGQISISSATSASQSFGTPYQSPPVCVVTPSSSPGSVTWWVTSTTSGVTVTLSASATISFNYSCFGNPD